MSRVLNSVANSGPSVGASSLVTDANSALSGGPHLQRSASINTESYLRLPASPMSFSSNNISGSSVMDGSSIVQQNSQHDQNAQHIHQRQQQQGASSATSQPTSQTGQVSSQTIQELNGLLPMQKKPKLDMRQDDVLQQQVMQQLLQRQDSIQLQGHNPQLQALFQQQRLLQQRYLQQQQMLQSLPPMQRPHMQQQQQQQLRQQLQQHGVHPASGVKRPHEGGICARRLMQYLYHQRQRPSDNNILYWRKFVAEYFAPRAKKRWCLSLYDSVGHSSLGVFPQAAMLDTWHCDICGSKSGRGFETTADILPRLNKIKFDSGVIDELLFVDMPQESRYPSGLMMLEYGKAVQESVYEQLRVVREGKLRIIFTPDLKILSWEYCARRHEELVPRRVLAPQVNQLLQVAQKYQNAVNESGSNGVSPQDLQTNCNMFVTAGRQITKNMDLQILNDLGFSKRYVRCLQISEVVNSMKDLIDFSREHKIGPIESLKTFPRQATAAKLQMQKMQEMEQLSNSQGLTTDQSSLHKMMAMRPGLSGHFNNLGSGTMNNSAQAAASLNNYQNLMRQNSMNASLNALQTDASSSSNGPNLSQSLPFQCPVSPVPGSLTNTISSSHQQQSHSHQQNQQQASQANQHMQPHVIQQLLQEMMNTNGQPVNAQNINGSANEDALNALSGTGNLPMRASTNMVELGSKTASMLNNSASMIPSRNNSFKNVANNPVAVSGNGFSMRSDALQNPHLAELVQDIPCEFTESGMFDSEPGDMGYGWKS